MDEPKDVPVVTPPTAAEPVGEVVPVTPPPQAPAVIPEAAPPQPARPPKVNKLYIIIGALLCLGVIAFGVLYARSITPAKVEPRAAVTPPPVVTPTPPPNISRIATTSAFAAFGQEIASFSAILESFTLQDSTLAPPILDLELNLTN